MSVSIPKQIKPVKVIVVGSCGVGKTALIAKYFKKQITQISTDTTISPASFHTTINLPDDVEAHMQIWDTAGQERFQSISTMFYRDSQVALVCFDDKAAGTIEQWINRVHNEVPECLILLVQTKADLLDGDQMLDANAKGVELKAKYSAHSFYLTSAIDGRMVDDVFFDAALFARVDEKSEATRSEVKEKETNKSGCC